SSDLGGGPGQGGGGRLGGGPRRRRGTPRGPVPNEPGLAGPLRTGPQRSGAPMNAAALSKSQRAYAWIRERITNQEYKPGYRLVLGSIAAELDMSVAPVRQPARQPEAEGLLTYDRTVGARVPLVEASQYGDSMQAQSILEATAAALSATHITAEDLQRAREYNAQMNAQVDHLDPHEFT